MSYVEQGQLSVQGHNQRFPDFQRINQHPRIPTSRKSPPEDKNPYKLNKFGFVSLAVNPGLDIRGIDGKPVQFAINVKPSDKLFQSKEQTADNVTYKIEGGKVIYSIADPLMGNFSNKEGLVYSLIQVLEIQKNPEKSDIVRSYLLTNIEGMTADNPTLKQVKFKLKDGKIDLGPEVPTDLCRTHYYITPETMHFALELANAGTQEEKNQILEQIKAQGNNAVVPQVEKTPNPTQKAQTTATRRPSVVTATQGPKFPAAKTKMPESTATPVPKEPSFGDYVEMFKLLIEWPTDMPSTPALSPTATLDKYEGVNPILAGADKSFTQAFESNPIVCGGGLIIGVLFGSYLLFLVGYKKGR